jgi:hypothetical protein
MGQAFKLPYYMTDSLTGKDVKLVFISGTLNNSGAAGKVAGVDYAVTTGKTFNAVGILPIISAAQDIVLRYADDAPLTTNPVSMTYYMPRMVLASPGMSLWLPLLGITAPAGKYIGLFTAGNSGPVVAYLVGYES